MFEMRMLKGEQDFRVERKKISASYEMKDTHFHPYFELYYLYSGSCDTFIKQEIYHVKAGDLILIPNMELHRTMQYSQGNNERIVLNFLPRFLEQMMKECGEDAGNLLRIMHASVPLGQRKYVENLLEQIVYETEKRDPYSRTVVKCHVYELLVFMQRIFQYKQDIPEQNTEAEQYFNAARYIGEHYQEELTLSSLSRRFSISPTYFSKRFKKYLSVGFKEYLIQIRIKEASVRLLETDKTITEIAEECGFEDSNYFSDVFRRTKGITPGQYRKTPLIV